MRIGVIGTGNMGSVLGRLLSHRGHQVKIGSTPAFFASAASSLPTSSACVDLSPLNDFGSAIQDADATVCPVSSSTSCAVMPRFERNTARRGRSAVPAPCRARGGDGGRELL